MCYQSMLYYKFKETLLKALTVNMANQAKIIRSNTGALKLRTRKREKKNALYRKTYYDYIRVIIKITRPKVVEP